MAERVLFSAYAEVFLRDGIYAVLIDSFLCLRRGVSDELRRQAEYDDFSLPTQRCFPQACHLTYVLYLFSAYAEVFLIR